MAASNLTMNIKLRWWVKPFIRSVIVVHAVTGWAPSEHFMAEIFRKYGFKITGPHSDV